jgi:hypothetical protein
MAVCSNTTKIDLSIEAIKVDLQAHNSREPEQIAKINIFSTQGWHIGEGKF